MSVLSKILQLTVVKFAFNLFCDCKFPLFTVKRNDLLNSSYIWSGDLFFCHSSSLFSIPVFIIEHCTFLHFSSANRFLISFYILPEFTQLVSIIHPYLSILLSRIRPNYFSREALICESFLIALPHFLFTHSSFWITLYTFQPMCKANNYAVHLSHLFSFYLCNHSFQTTHFPSFNSWFYMVIYIIHLSIYLVFMQRLFSQSCSTFVTFMTNSSFRITLLFLNITTYWSVVIVHFSYFIAVSTSHFFAKFIQFVSLNFTQNFFLALLTPDLIWQPNLIQFSSKHTIHSYIVIINFVSIMFPFVDRSIDLLHAFSTWLWRQFFPQKGLNLQPKFPHSSLSDSLFPSYHFSRWGRRHLRYRAFPVSWSLLLGNGHSAPISTLFELLRLLLFWNQLEFPIPKSLSYREICYLCVHIV